MEARPIPDGNSPLNVKRVSLAQAKGDLADLIEAVKRGDEVVIDADGKTPVQLVLVKPVANTRELGVYRGKILMREDFNEPISEEAWLSGHP